MMPNTSSMEFGLVEESCNRCGNQCHFKTVLLANGFRRTSRPMALSSRQDVIRDLPDRTLLMLSVTLLKLFLSEEAQSCCWDVHRMTVGLTSLQ
jgi:hypothetical protein